MTGIAGAAKVAGAMIAFDSTRDSAGREGIEDSVNDRRPEDANTAEDTATCLASGGGSGNSGMESAMKIRWPVVANRDAGTETWRASG
jgi:hypothetical protein